MGSTICLGYRLFRSSPSAQVWNCFLIALGLLPDDLRGVQWESLELLQMEGFVDIGALLSRCPNVKDLRLSIPEGFRGADCLEFISLFRHIPKLESLMIAPFDMAADDRSGREAFLLYEIAKAAPNLRHVDMSTGRYDNERRSFQFSGITCSREQYQVGYQVGDIQILFLHSIKMPCTVNHQQPASFFGSQLPRLAFQAGLPCQCLSTCQECPDGTEH
jgi:hypothetical protein